MSVKGDAIRKAQNMKRNRIQKEKNELNRKANQLAKEEANNCIQGRTHWKNNRYVPRSRVLPHILTHCESDGSRSYQDGSSRDHVSLSRTQSRYAPHPPTRLQRRLYVGTNWCSSGFGSRVGIRGRVRSFAKAISSVLLSDMSYEYLIIGPGAMGIFSMLGYLKSVENTLHDVKGYSGASAGAIICTFLALGYSVEETLYKLLELDPSKLVKLNLKCFINSYGLVDLKPVRQQLVNLLESDPTFSEIDKTLYISAFCVNTSRTEYFSKHTHPDMKVIDAICMSIASFICRGSSILISCSLSLL